MGVTISPRLAVLNIEVDKVDFGDIERRFCSSRVVLTPNMDHLSNLQLQPQFYRIYRSADLVVCDSRVLSLLIRILRRERVAPIPGSELFPRLCRARKSDPGFKVFLLGGTTPEHAALASVNLSASTGVNVVGCYSPPFGFELMATEFEKICDLIRASSATVVGVGVGSPKQELFIERLLEVFPTGLTFVGIGATIDFESGLVARAPRVMQVLCLEWLYRALREPRRMFLRYFFYDLRVVWLLFNQARGKYTNPFMDSKIA